MEKHIARLTQRFRYEELESQALELADVFLSDKSDGGIDSTEIERLAKERILTV